LTQKKVSRDKSSYVSSLLHYLRNKNDLKTSPQHKCFGLLTELLFAIKIIALLQPFLPLINGI
jgi:hypothetical protein